MEGWTCIYTSTQFQEIEFTRGMLEEQQITAFVVNKKDSVYLFGEIELYVRVEDAFAAYQIIKSS